jgi:NitT/TauT family transport system ATP-binding protein
MVRWGHVVHEAGNIKIAAESFRPDIYRESLAASGAAVPTANSKVEGALAETTAVGVSARTLFLGPDGFFDRKVFDPDEIEAYILAQK